MPSSGAKAARRMRPPDEAADLTQEFFARLLSSEGLSKVDPSRGKFRSFLLASLKNLMANEWNRARCQKRGGGAAVLSLDEQAAEDRYKLEPVDHLTPERLFERRWAETVLAQALARLRLECDSADRTRRFDELKLFLIGEQGNDSLAAAAERLRLTLPALKGLVHRLRARFREIVREEIEQTVSTPEAVEEEIRHLCAVFGQ